MSKRLRRQMQRQQTPRYGDEIMIPSEHPDGHWCNGIVNSGLPSGRDHDDGKMLVVATDHAKSNLVLIPVNGYRKDWCWPADVGVMPSGVKVAALSDIEG